ncbi:MAG: hypothetical protein ACHQWU_16205 [Gemmatimonadales bacterium]
MSDDERGHRFGLALAMAPLAAPAAVLFGTAVFAVVKPQPGTEGINPVAGLIFVAALLLVYGAPLAYGATFGVLWPAAVLLRDAGRFTWWSMTLLGAAGGGALFPMYLHLLAPQGTWHFFPGAGYVGGAATGWAFWFVATGGSRRMSTVAAAANRSAPE